MSKGRSTFKVGADVNIERIANFFPGYFSGSYSFPSYAAFAARHAHFLHTGLRRPRHHRRPPLIPTSTNTAFYAQATTRVTDRLTLNYGIRYDLFDYAQGTIRNPDAGLARSGLNTDVIPVDKQQHRSPFRLGFEALGQQ